MFDLYNWFFFFRIKKLFKLAYKFQNHDLLAKLEADMNMLEYSEQNEGNLRSERLKINEKSHKKYKNPDSERIDNHPIKLVYAQNKGSDNDESFRKNMKVLRNISNINILRNGKMIPFILPERDLQGGKYYHFKKNKNIIIKLDEELQQNSDRSENSGSESNNEYYDDDDDSDTYESSDDADNIILKDGNKDSDTEQLK